MDGNIDKAREALIGSGFIIEKFTMGTHPALKKIDEAIAALSAIDPETIRSEARAELIKKMRPIIDDMDCTCGGESEDSDHSYENSGCWKHDMMEILSAEPAPDDGKPEVGDIVAIVFPSGGYSAGVWPVGEVGGFLAPGERLIIIMRSTEVRRRIEEAKE